jgi:hypothetical protein
MKKAKLDQLYPRNVPVPAGGKVDRAIQLIRFCGDLYRDLRLSYPEAAWNRRLATQVQTLVLRARDALDLPPFTFWSGDEGPHDYWNLSYPLLQSCAAARSAQRGHIEDVLIAGSLLSNGFHESYSDDLTASLAEGYCSLLPTLAVMAAPLADVARVAEFDVPAWFDYDGDERDASFDPAVAAVRPDADLATRRSLLEGLAPSTRDAILAVRASLGLPVEPDEARGDMRAMARYFSIGAESWSYVNYQEVWGWMCLIYLAARDTPLLLAGRLKQIKQELGWVNDWYFSGWYSGGPVPEWPPFPTSRDPELSRVPVTPSAVPVENSASPFGSAAAVMSATHYERGEMEESRAWALIAAGVGVPQGFLILAQLAVDNDDPAAAADWALRGLALPAPEDDPAPLLDLGEEEETGESGESELHLIAAVSLAQLDRTQESLLHLVAAADAGNQKAQTIIDGMLTQNDRSPRD